MNISTKIRRKGIRAVLDELRRALEDEARRARDSEYAEACWLLTDEVGELANRHTARLHEKR